MPDLPARIKKLEYLIPLKMKGEEIGVVRVSLDSDGGLTYPTGQPASDQDSPVVLEAIITNKQVEKTLFEGVLSSVSIDYTTNPQ